jgi:hypothetical protein
MFPCATVAQSPVRINALLLLCCALAGLQHRVDGRASNCEGGHDDDRALLRGHEGNRCGSEGAGQSKPGDRSRSSVSSWWVWTSLIERINSGVNTARVWGRTQQQVVASTSVKGLHECTATETRNMTSTQPQLRRAQT